MRADTPHLLFSCSKPFAAVLIANLINDQIIGNENDFLIEYMPEFSSTAFQDVTIRHLLDMQSGLDLQEVVDPSAIARACGFAPPGKGENIKSLMLKIICFIRGS